MFKLTASVAWGKLSAEDKEKFTSLMLAIKACQLSKLNIDTLATDKLKPAIEKIAELSIEELNTNPTIIMAELIKTYIDDDKEALKDMTKALNAISSHFYKAGSESLVQAFVALELFINNKDDKGVVDRSHRGGQVYTNIKAVVSDIFTSLGIEYSLTKSEENKCSFM